MPYLSHPIDGRLLRSREQTYQHSQWVISDTFVTSMQCPLWVRSDGLTVSDQCPLCPRKRPNCWIEVSDSRARPPVRGVIMFLIARAHGVIE